MNRVSGHWQRQGTLAECRSARSTREWSILATIELRPAGYHTVFEKSVLLPVMGSHGRGGAPFLSSANTAAHKSLIYIANVDSCRTSQ